MNNLGSNFRVSNGSGDGHGLTVFHIGLGQNEQYDNLDSWH